MPSAKFFIGGHYREESKINQMKKAVDHFLKGEYDQINDGLSASGSMIAKGIDDNNDDGFGYEETGMFIPDENS